MKEGMKVRKEEERKEGGKEEEEGNEGEDGK